jgi:nicotinate-nucleotide pyrophosphorylase (carboxylating)
MEFTPAETAVCRRLVDWALEEDVGLLGDLTSRALIPIERQGRAAFVARTAGVVAGLPAVALVFAAVDPGLRLECHKQDGDRLQPGEPLATAAGPMRSLLTAERTALNFLQHLSGIAALTRRYVDLVAGLPGRILDTRKTTPGWRLLEKYAVRCGGGANHRLGLSDAILIKDNHLAALQIADWRLQIGEAIQRARNLQSQICNLQSAKVPVDVEVDTLEQLGVALAGRPDMILLDNMPPEKLREAVRRRNELAPDVQLEASGGVNLETVRAIAETGVDRISIGALTHSAPALDIALDYVT